MPYFTFVGLASGPLEQVRARLEANVSPTRRFTFAWPATEFQGSVTEGRFSIMRVVRGRDSFNPWIRGVIRSGPAGTIVEATLTLHPGAWCFLLIWSWFLGRPALRAVKAMWQGSDAPTAPMTLFMFLFAWVMAVGLFYFNAVQVKKVMFRLLELHDAVRLGG